jgi:hypothetical protein
LLAQLEPSLAPPNRTWLFNREWARIYANEKYWRLLAMIRGLKSLPKKCRLHLMGTNGRFLFDGDHVRLWHASSTRVTSEYLMI